jgi:hypothetical protein
MLLEKYAFSASMRACCGPEPLLYFGGGNADWQLF